MSRRIWLTNPARRLTSEETGPHVPEKRWPVAADSQLPSEAYRSNARGAHHASVDAVEMVRRADGRAIAPPVVSTRRPEAEVMIVSVFARDGWRCTVTGDYMLVPSGCTGRARRAAGAPLAIARSHDRTVVDPRAREPEGNDGRRRRRVATGVITSGASRFPTDGASAKHAGIATSLSRSTRRNGATLGSHAAARSSRSVPAQTIRVARRVNRLFPGAFRDRRARRSALASRGRATAWRSS